MKTLLFTLEYPPFHGGVADYYGNLVKYWPERDGIAVLNNNDGRLINNKLPFLKWLPAIFAFKKEVKKQNINHVIIGHILPLGTVACLCSRFSKIKYSVILHGMDFTYAMRRPWKKWLARKILTNAEKIICTNSFTAEMARRAIPWLDNKIEMVNPGVDILATRNSQLAAQLKKQYYLENKIILLSVGRLVKRKGFDKVIEALPEVLKKVPDLIYVIVGNGEEIGNWKLEIGNLGLGKHIYIINQANDEERNSWYNISDIFVMPSRNINGDFEGFGIVYLEANLAGKPVIAGCSGGEADAVVDGLNGLIVNSENTAAIAAAIIKLASDSKLRQKLGEQGRGRAINEFNWQKQINKIYQLI